MDPIICEHCKKQFSSEDALYQHQQAKHKDQLPKEKKPLDKKKIKKWATLFSVTVLGIWFMVWFISGFAKAGDLCKTAPVAELNIGGHANINLHIHANLRIVIDSVEQQVPSGIGIAPNIMRPLHTHDATGEIHIEGLCIRSYRLGEFFDVWKRTFNSSCIFDHCTDNGRLRMTVNGEENFLYDKYIMQDNDNIVIEYTSDNEQRDNK